MFSILFNIESLKSCLSASSCLQTPDEKERAVDGKQKTKEIICEPFHQQELSLNVNSLLISEFGELLVWVVSCWCVW